MTTKEARMDPEFVRLEHVLGFLQVRMTAVMEEMTVRFPPQHRWAWSLTAANTVGQFPVVTDSPDSDI